MVLQGPRGLVRLELLVLRDQQELLVWLESMELLVLLALREQLDCKVMLVRLVLLELKVPREQRELAQQELRGLLELQV